jgi:hypothetical protein
VSDFVKRNLSKTGIISFIRKVNRQNYQNVFANFLASRNCCINDPSVHIDRKVYYDYHDFFTHHETAGLIRTVNFPFHAINSLLMLWFALVRSELNVFLSLGNSVAASDFNSLLQIQRKFAALSAIYFLSQSVLLLIY